MSSLAMYEAAGKGDAAAVRRLIKEGAPVDWHNKDRDGETALIKAAANGQKEVVAVLLEAGASVNAVDNDGWTALIFAADNGKKEVVAVLLEAGANVNAAANAGFTALMVAAAKGEKEVVAVLLEAGADPTAKNKGGWTPLIIAASNGKEAVVEELIKQGVGVRGKTDGGKTAMSEAKANSHHKVVELLEAQAKWDDYKEGEKIHATEGETLDVAVGEIAKLAMATVKAAIGDVAGLLTNVQDQVVNMGWETEGSVEQEMQFKYNPETHQYISLVTSGESSVEMAGCCFCKSKKHKVELTIKYIYAKAANEEAREICRDLVTNKANKGLVDHAAALKQLRAAP